MSGLTLYTIYHNPSDYPGLFVVRRFMVVQGGVDADTTPLLTCGTLDEARNGLPFGLTCLVRDETDDPCIVETWL